MNYFKTGKEYTETEEQRTRLTVAISEIKWHPFKPGVHLPAMPGLAIKEVIKKLHIPKVSMVGYGHGLAPYGLIAVMGTWKDGAHIIYWLDTGTGIKPIAEEPGPCAKSF